MTFEVVVNGARSNGYYRFVKRVYTRQQAMRLVARAKRMGKSAKFFKA
jgi:hypothetical protein